MQTTYTGNYPERYKALERDAYAKIIWGDNPYDVILWLQGEGVKNELAQDIVGNAIKERRAEIRTSGWKHLLLGSSVMLSVIFGYIFLPKLTSVALKNLVIGSAVGGGFGFLQVCKGVSRIITARESGAISDMD